VRSIRVSAATHEGLSRSAAAQGLSLADMVAKLLAEAENA
jgi:predicted HicB family RNase H-like nuclease